jgi:hypothetical protein
MSGNHPVEVIPARPARSYLGVALCSQAGSQLTGLRVA